MQTKEKESEADAGEEEKYRKGSDARCGANNRRRANNSTVNYSESNFIAPAPPPVSAVEPKRIDNVLAVLAIRQRV